jgi:hypothetical protein
MRIVSLKRIFARSIVLVAFASALPMVSSVSAGTPLVSATPLVPSTTRDGSKDFDFLYGSWNVHTRILRKLFAHSHVWIDCDGRDIVKPFANGSGNLEVGDIHCPDGTTSGITPRIYNATTHQWSLYWATEGKGLSGPPQVGHFYPNGVGVFDTYYTYRGIPTVARYRWRVQNGHPYFEQLYSKDNGKTWELNWTSVYTRSKR